MNGTANHSVEGEREQGCLFPLLQEPGGGIAVIKVAIKKKTSKKAAIKKKNPAKKQLTL